MQFCVVSVIFDTSVRFSKGADIHDIGNMRQ